MIVINNGFEVEYNSLLEYIKVIKEEFKPRLSELILCYNNLLKLKVDYPNANAFISDYLKSNGLCFIIECNYIEIDSYLICDGEIGYYFNSLFNSPNYSYIVKVFEDFNKMNDLINSQDFLEQLELNFKV